MRHPRWRLPFSRGGTDSAGSRPLEAFPRCVISSARLSPAPPIRLPFFPFAFRFIAFLLSPPLHYSLRVSGSVRGTSRSHTGKAAFVRALPVTCLVNSIREGKRARDRSVVSHSVPTPRTRCRDSDINDCDYADNESARG